jgi:uncharacterized protein (DUF486 family)
VDRSEDGVPLVLQQCFHDVCLVRPSEESRQPPWIVAVLVSWGIAFFEYMLQVPANRIGHHVLNVGQLKILQEVITLAVFVPFSVLYMKERIRLDYLWAGLCILGAVFFIFRQKLFGGAWYDADGLWCREKGGAMSDSEGHPEPTWYTAEVAETWEDIEARHKWYSCQPPGPDCTGSSGAIPPGPFSKRSWSGPSRTTASPRTRSGNMKWR